MYTHASISFLQACFTTKYAHLVLLCIFHKIPESLVKKNQNWQDYPMFIETMHFLYSIRTPHSWSTSCQKATSTATNYIQFSTFLWAFTWYHSWKEWCGSKSYIFKNLMNYFLKLFCLFTKHKHCQVGKIYQLLTINQLKFKWQKTWSVDKGLWNQSTEPSIQQNSIETSQDCPLYNKIGTWRSNCTMLLPKKGWEGWAHLVLP